MEKNGSDIEFLLYESILFILSVSHSLIVQSSEIETITSSDEQKKTPLTPSR